MEKANQIVANTLAACQQELARVTADRDQLRQELAQLHFVEMDRFANGRIRVEVEVISAIPLKLTNPSQLRRGALDVVIKPLGLTLCGCMLTWDGYALRIDMPMRPKPIPAGRTHPEYESVAVWGNVAYRDIFSRSVLRSLSEYLTKLNPAPQFEQYFNLPPLFWEVNHKREFTPCYCMRIREAQPFQHLFQSISSGYEEERALVTDAMRTHQLTQTPQQREDRALQALGQFIPSALKPWERAKY